MSRAVSTTGLPRRSCWSRSQGPGPPGWRPAWAAAERSPSWRWGCSSPRSWAARWAAGDFAGSAVLALAVCAYASALALHGNGFIAAFVGGLAFRAIGGRPGERLVPFVEETGALVSLLVWLAFGAIAVVPALESLTWQIVVYSVLSLMVIRVAPAA